MGTNAPVGAIIVNSVAVGRRSDPIIVMVVQVGAPIKEVMGAIVWTPDRGFVGRPDTNLSEVMNTLGRGLRPVMTEVGGTGIIHVVSMTEEEPSAPITVKLA